MAIVHLHVHWLLWMNIIRWGWAVYSDAEWLTPCLMLWWGMSILHAAFNLLHWPASVSIGCSLSSRSYYTYRSSASRSCLVRALMILKRPLQKLQDRYGRYKFDPVLYVTTDECCTSADLLRGIFGNGLLIMLDIFHFMQRIADSTYGITHPAFLEFMQRLRQAIFVCYPEDKQQVRRLAGPNRNSFSHWVEGWHRPTSFLSLCPSLCYVGHWEATCTWS